MTLFKAATAPNIPLPLAYPATGLNDLNDFRVRERRYLKEFLVVIFGQKSSHNQSNKLWENVFKHISVGADPGYTVTVTMPSVPPPLGLVSEAGILFTMWCIRAKILEYLAQPTKQGPQVAVSDADEDNILFPPKIVRDLGKVLHKYGFYIPSGSEKLNEFYNLLAPDLITISGTDSRRQKMFNFAPTGKLPQALTEIKTILEKEIDLGAKCFYTGFFSDNNLFIGAARLIASGDGSGTSGLMGLEPNVGQIFFSYEYDGSRNNLTGGTQNTFVRGLTNASFPSAGLNVRTTIHLAIDGLDYPGSGIDPGYEGVTNGTEKSNTTVEIKINGDWLKFRANSGLQTLTPINMGDCSVNPPLATAVNFSFTSNRTSLVVANYSKLTGDLTFTATDASPIEVKMRSGQGNDIEEAILYLSVIRTAGGANRGLVGLFNPDKFELDLAQKLTLKTDFLDVTLPAVNGGTSQNVKTHLIETVKNFSTAQAITANKKINLASSLSQGFIGLVVANATSTTPLVVNTNLEYKLSLARTDPDPAKVRKLEIVSIPTAEKPAAAKRRASMVGVEITENNVNFNVVSFEDESWSRLDNKVVGVTSELTEPRFADITDVDRLHKLRTLDLKTEYKRVSRPTTSTALTGLLASYTNIGATEKHPNPNLTSTNGTDIANPSTQVTGFIPCYNPVLGGLRSLGVLEALRDNLAKESSFNYYVFSQFHELLFNAVVPASPATSGMVSDLGLAKSVNYFEYQTLKWYNSDESLHDIDKYHADVNDTFKILIPPGSGSFAPNGQAFPAITSGSSVDVYLCVAKNQSSGFGGGDKFVNSSYRNNPSSEIITITLSDPQNDSFIEFYDQMENNTVVAGGQTGTVVFRLFSVPDAPVPAGTSLPSTSYPRNNFGANDLIVGVGGVAKFKVKKPTAGDVLITVTQAGSSPISSVNITLTFV